MMKHSDGDTLRVVSGTDGFRTFSAVEVRVFRRLRTCRQEFPDAGGAGRGVFVAGGVALI